MAESRKIHTRPCPSCRIPILGIQTGNDEDWHIFTCVPCDEEWGENVRYCLPEVDLDPPEFI